MKRQELRDQLFGFWKLITTWVTSGRNDTPKIAAHFPQAIGNYTFDKPFDTQKFHRSFSFGVYKGRKNKKALAKVWTGDVKNFDYYSLKNEIIFYQFVEYITKEYKEEFQKYFPDIRIPQLIEVSETDHQLLMLIEEISLPPLKFSSVSKKVSVYEKVMQYLLYLGSFPQVRNSGISYRSITQIIIIFYLASGLALVRRPQQWLPIIKSIGIFTLRIPQLVTDHRTTIAHRSLEDHNIFAQGKEIVLIDFQLTVITHPFLEVMQSLFFSWNDLEFRKKFLSSGIVKEATGDTKNAKVFQALALYTAIHQLAEAVTPKEQALSFLEYGLHIPVPPAEPMALPEKCFNVWINCISFCMSVVGPVLNLLPTDQKQTIIMCYHNVGEDNWRFTTPAHVFEEHIQFFQKTGSVVSLTEALSNPHPEKTQYVITFDDGYEGLYHTAAPILEKYHMPATVFVLGTPQQANRYELNNNLEFMSVQQIKQLIKKGWEVGYHTATHADLRQMTEKDVHKEVGYTKQVAEKVLGTTMRYFAYPRGIYNTKIKNIVQNSSYIAAFTVDGGVVTTKDMYAIDRVPMEGKVTTSELAAIVTPLGLLSLKIFMRVLQYKEHTSLYLRGAFQS